MRAGVDVRVAWSVLGAVGLVAAAFVAAPVSPLVTSAAIAVEGALAAAAFFAGPRLVRAPRRPWQCFGASFVLSVLSVPVYAWSRSRTGAAGLAPNALAIPSYLLLLSGLVLLLRSRRGLERHAVTDGVIVCLGAGTLSIIVFVLPAAEDMIGGIYPLLDIVLLLLLVNLAFTTAVHSRSWFLLTGGAALLLAADVAAALARVQGFSPRLPGLPYVLAFVLLGCAALHPSAVELARPLPRPVQAWSWPRLALLVPALSVPFVLPLVHETTRADRVVLAVGGAGMVLALLFRAASAVAAYAGAQEVFRYQATHDGLTGLPNRATVTAITDRLLTTPRSDGRTVWLLLLDLDDFTMVNDSWGHEAGDRVIGEVARTLRAALPHVGTLARPGEDEFVLVLPAHRVEAEGAADALLAALAEPLSIDGTEVLVAASIGLATADATTTAEGLLRDADTAMYRAKAEGRRRWVVFDRAMHVRRRERMELELALRAALTGGDLQVAYQPIVRMQTGAVIGAEALVRWRHPVRGPVPPATFIPIAEEAGLITEIGELVLTQALHWTATWRRAGVVGADFWISVNVSTRQLRDDRIVGTVRRELAATGLPACALCLEITESVMLDESEVTQRVLMDLRGLGVRLVVDDFGTGYSALGYLRRHPVTGVKIDRSFVDGLTAPGEDEEIVRAVVAMASALGLTVVAEGVELDGQRQVLESLGVGYGQGHLWGRAVDPVAFAVSPATIRTRMADEIMAAPPLTG